MKLKRKYARLIIILLALDVLFVLLGHLLVRWYAPAFLVIADACAIVTLSLLTPYLWLRLLLWWQWSPRWALALPTATLLMELATLWWAERASTMRRRWLLSCKAHWATLAMLPPRPVWALNRNSRILLLLSLNNPLWFLAMSNEQ